MGVGLAAMAVGLAVGDALPLGFGAEVGAHAANDNTAMAAAMLMSPLRIFIRPLCLLAIVGATRPRR